MIASVLLLVGGIGVLYFGAEWLVRGAARMAAALEVSPIVMGLTVVSLGTSAPELVVCVVSTLRGSGDLAIGNVLGSNMANVGLILGITAMARPLRIAARVVSREVPLMLIITALLYPVLGDLHLSRLDGAYLVLILAAYLAFLVRTAGGETPEVLGQYEEFARETVQVSTRNVARDLGLVTLGCGGLVVGGYAIVEGAVHIAHALGISELVIGVSVVAVGTSLPELATTLVAALRGEADIALGNVVGSNIFNVAAILGITSLVRPFDVDATVLSVEYPAAFILSLILLPIVWTRSTIQRAEGAVLLVTYVALAFWVFAG